MQLVPDPGQPDSGHPAAGSRTLGLDIGGSHLKAGVLASTGVMVGAPVRADTPQPAAPQAVMDALVALIAPLAPATRISCGFPGVVRGGVVLTAPNLGTHAWHGFPLADELARRLGHPARVLNDASVQGLGVIAGRGLECVITLGTGMGFALFQDGRLTPHLELSQMPVRRHTSFDDWIGDAARLETGPKRWNRRVGKVIHLLRTLVNFDVLLIGGGNAKYLTIDLAADVRLVPNQAGITGGVRLWDPIMDDAFAPMPQAFRALVGPA